MIPLFKAFNGETAVSNVATVLRSGWTGQGPKVDQFEREFQELVQSPSPILALNSCTSAIDLALHLLNVKPGDHIVVSPMTCAATVCNAANRGAHIVWADVDPHTGLIDPEDVAKRISKEVKAIIAVDWGGAPCDYEKLRQFGIPVIEDAAHALLSSYQGFPISQTGADIVCWSLQSIKHLSTGDGGMLLVPRNMYERAKLLRWYGLDRTTNADFRSEQLIHEIGYKYHMNDIAAAIGLGNITYAEEIVQKHRGNAWFYDNFLDSSPKVRKPTTDSGSSWWLYTLLVEDKLGLQQYLKEQGITSSQVHTRLDCHPALSHFRSSLPGVDHFSQRNLAIPVHWGLDHDDKCRVVRAVNEWGKL